MESHSDTAIPTLSHGTSTCPDLLRFSVIIPLEFHRGQGHDCLRGWTQGQDFPRDQFEIVLAIPPSFPEDEAAAMRAMLATHDQAIDLPHNHDIALCAAAAKHARGECLFFTESHCLPEKDVLTQADLAFQTHPEWVGFSCESVPVTHNLLSQVEAALYDRDIKHAMQHPWRKVLDQGFVVQRQAYLAAGGFEAEMGHFGEWLLSARFRLRGLNLGYWPAARIHHYYVGELPEWREFTEDFAEGEMRFMTKALSDRAGTLFDEAPVWSARFALDRRWAGRMAKMLSNDLKLCLSLKGPLTPAPQEVWENLVAWNWVEMLRWQALAFWGGRAQGFLYQMRVWRAHARLRWSLLRKDVPAAGVAIASLCTSLARFSGHRFLRRLKNLPKDTKAPTTHSAEDECWVPEKFSERVHMGFHSHETWQDQSLRWSEPAAMVELPLTAGLNEVCLDILERPGLLDIRFYLNEKLVPARKVRIQGTFICITLHRSKNAPVRFGWVCNPYASPNDPRRLGLAVRRVTWKRRA